VNLARHLARAFIAQEIVLQQCREFWFGFVLAPAGPKLAHELRGNVLVGRGAFFEKVGQPFDGATLVGNE